jgi:hypothetical protein
MDAKKPYPQWKKTQHVYREKSNFGGHILGHIFVSKTKTSNVCRETEKSGTSAILLRNSFVGMHKPSTR